MSVHVCGLSRIPTTTHAEGRSMVLGGNEGRKWRKFYPVEKVGQPGSKRLEPDLQEVRS